MEYSPIFPPCGGEQGGVLSDYFVIANIPYYITSPILKHFLYEIEYKPKKMLILMQKDVGDRITLTPNPSPIKQLEERKIAKHKKGKSSVLSLFVQKKYFVKEVLFV
ncbi:MAG: hypothetical protein LBQ59_03130 [Candidatus Peribacteria bacterium]|nr:hypothetical protein [Candidatus Peribacteria bacterium]